MDQKMDLSGVFQCPHSGLAVVDHGAYDGLPMELANMAALPALDGECAACICNDTCISLDKEVLDRMLSETEFQINFNGSSIKTQLQSWGDMWTALKSSDLANVSLSPQPNNRFDDTSVIVRSNDVPIGYIPMALPEKPELFKWLQQGNKVNILAVMQMGKDATETRQLEFNLGTDRGITSRINSNSPEILTNSAKTTLQDTPATKVRGSSTSQSKPITCAYKFEGFTYLKPNMSKAGSKNWSKNWVGYVSLKGRYWESKLGDQTRPFAGIQVTVNRSNDGTLVASQYSGKGEYRYNGIISPAIGGKSNFIKAVNYYINNVGFDDMVVDQLKSTGNLFHDYTIEKKVVIR